MGIYLELYNNIFNFQILLDLLFFISNKIVNKYCRIASIMVIFLCGVEIIITGNLVLYD